MLRNRSAIQENVLSLLRELADDWEYTENITEDTYLFSDMGLESLDVVVLGTAVQEHYGQTLPFPEFFAEIGQREIRDISVGEWVNFIYENLDGVPA